MPFLISICGIFFLAIGFAQLVIGYMGIEHYFGHVVAIIVLTLSCLLKFILPITIATFFGATVVLGWPWYLALLITLPGLFFIVPSMVVFVLESISPKKNKDY